jgi:hypothetical protein
MILANVNQKPNQQEILMQVFRAFGIVLPSVGVWAIREMGNFNNSS